MIKGIFADIIVGIYLMASLYLRFDIEPYFVGRPILSVGFGLFMLLLLWAAIKSGLLKPNYFGLIEESKAPKKEKKDDDQMMFI